MSEISATGPTPTRPATASQTSGKAGVSDDDGTATAISSDFETFLRMLTAQVQNQDPLNPMDSTDFAVQLATFSSVEQQVLTNDLLKGLSASIGGNDLAQLAGWIGMDARAPAPAVFDGNPIYVEAEPAPASARAELRVFGETGALWDQFDIPVQAGPLIWDGLRADGSPFPSGVYTFEVWSFDGEENRIGNDIAETYNRVVEVQLGANGPELLLGNGIYIPSSEISAVKSPSPPQ